MKEYTLPIMLLTKMAVQSQSPSEGAADATEDEAAVQDVFNSFVDVLLQCNNFPAALTRITIPVLDRYVHVQMFSRSLPR